MNERKSWKAKKISGHFNVVRHTYTPWWQLLPITFASEIEIARPIEVDCCLNHRSQSRAYGVCHVPFQGSTFTMCTPPTEMMKKSIHFIRLLESNTCGMYSCTISILSFCFNNLVIMAFGSWVWRRRCIIELVVLLPLPTIASKEPT